MDLFGAQCSVLARFQRIIEHQRAHAFAVQAQHFVVEVAEHPLHLMVPALDDAQSRRFRPEYDQLGRLRGEVFEREVQALGKFQCVLRANLLLGLDVIDLRQFGLRLSQAPRPAAVVGDQHQAGGVEIQATGDVQVIAVRLMDQVEYGRMLRVAGGADAAGRFVQHEVACGLADLQDFPVDLDTAELEHFGMRVADDFSVNLNALFHQQQAYLLTVEARQVAEETVNAHGWGSVGKGPRILRDRPGGCLQLRLDLGAARAQAGFVAQFGWQRFKHSGVDTDAKAPARLIDGARVGQGAGVGGAAGGALVWLVHAGLFIAGVRQFHAGSVTAGLFGPVHRMIGPGEQGVQGFIDLQGGEADADGQLQFLAVVGITLLFDMLTNFLGDHQTGLTVGVLEQHDELFATPAADDVGVSQATLQIPRETDQHLIAGQVAVGVVQNLEMIQIQQHRGQRLGLAPGFEHGLRRQQVEATTIRQFGQAVERRLCLDLALIALDHTVEQQQHDQGDEQTNQQIEVQRLADFTEGAVLALVDKQVPVQLGNKPHVEEMALALDGIFIAAAVGFWQLTDQVLHVIEVAELLADVRALRATLGARQHQAAEVVDEVHAALVTLLVFVDQLDYRIDRQANAGSADETVVVVIDLVVDEEGQVVFVGEVRVDIDLVGIGHVADTEIPGIARFRGLDLFEHAFGVVVGEAGVGDKKCRVGAVVGHDLVEVASHFLGVLLAVDHPVTHEGVAGHHRGNQDRSDKVFLDFRVDRVRGQRQLGVDDAVTDGRSRGVVTEERGREKACAQQRDERQDQRTLRIQRRVKRHGDSVGSDPMAGILMALRGK